MNFLQGYKGRYPTIKTLSHSGPLALVDGALSDEDLQLALAIVARYSKGRGAPSVRLSYTAPEAEAQELEVKPLGPTQIQQEWML